MPHEYEAMRDKFAKDMSYDAAQGKAARIFNSRHPDNPVGPHSDKKKKHATAKKGWSGLIKG